MTERSLYLSPSSGSACHKHCACTVGSDKLWNKHRGGKKAIIRKATSNQIRGHKNSYIATHTLPLKSWSETIFALYQVNWTIFFRKAFTNYRSLYKNLTSDLDVKVTEIQTYLRFFSRWTYCINFNILHGLVYKLVSTHPACLAGRQQYSVSLLRLRGKKQTITRSLNYNILFYQKKEFIKHTLFWSCHQSRSCGRRWTNALLLLCHNRSWRYFNLQSVCQCWCLYFVSLCFVITAKLCSWRLWQQDILQR